MACTFPLPPLLPVCLPLRSIAHVPTPSSLYFLRPPNAPSMRVVSGIAVSFDGKTSQYLALPPLLPRRPTEWHQVPPCAGDQASDDCIATIDGGRGNLPTGRSSAVTSGLVSSTGGAGSAANEAALKRPAKGRKGDDSPATALGVTSGRSGGRGATCWEALPKRAVEAVALFVSCQ